ncbi:hypothetical protein [Billgrantia lactosivorans]|uniref:capsular polysaccharide export protein, LipB/KpsS family n=1 Tax=Billgrantia lactosivorans TaxID=2185141 RepID=UPI0013A6AE90|nr:hypothetical protein [Halomonas lactosivorans]
MARYKQFEDCALFSRKKGPLGKEVKSFIESRLRSWLGKKKPQGEKYPYDVHDPFLALGDKSGYESLYLVGDSWLDNPEHPIIVVIGCNDWKFGFVADYLPDYRVAFLPRKKVGFSAIKLFFRLKVKPAVVLVWGYTESKLLSRYLKLARYPVWRIEDGFVRSAELGASHATPYSLVIDKTGFYYNCYQPSDIENVLNYHDFNADRELLEKAAFALEELKALRLSKYNLPAINERSGVKLKKRVIVIGQVDADASIRYGNPDGWTSEDLVKLAYYENPDAEVVYRPHPEVYKGFQKSAFKKKRVEKFAKIASPEEGGVDFIESSDHVYTITSLTGLEALIRGKKVTLVGAPFYSGWGLTDDRVKIERRGRNLSLTELFLASYILYPKYLANLSDSFVGLMASCYRISAERESLSLTSWDKNEGFGKYFMMPSFQWPAAFWVAKKAAEPGFDIKILKLCDHRVVLGSFNGDVYSKIIPYFILGSLSGDKARDAYLGILRGFVDADLFNEILVFLEAQYPGDYLLKHWVWLFSIKDDFHSKHLEKRLASTWPGIVGKKAQYSGGRGINKEPLRFVDLREDKEACATAINIYEQMIDSRDFDGFLDMAKKLLISGEGFCKVIKGLVIYSNICFDYKSSASFSLLIQSADIFLGNRFGVLSEFRSYNSCSYDRNRHLQVLSKLIIFRPDKLIFALNDVEKFDGLFYSFDRDVVLSQLRLCAIPSAMLVQAYIDSEEFTKSEHLARRLVASLDDPSEMDVIRLSQALSYNGKLEEALSVMKSVRSRGLSAMNVVESMRLFVLKGLYAESLDLMNKALSQKIDIGEMHRRKAYFGNGMICEAFETFTEIGIRCSVEKYYKSKYYNFDSPLGVEEKVFLLAIFGPGDEIRFASIYNSIVSHLGASNVVIACSPRLKSLFSRSFPGLRFVPVERPRNSDRIDLENYTRVPGSDIIGVVDNVAADEVAESDKVLFVTDLLHRVLPSKDEFPGIAYLSPDPVLVRRFQERLKKYKGKTLVGVSWRSSLATSARNEHYLSIEQLSKIFDIEGVQFVNFQYDECQEELDWVEARFPGKLIDFEDVDHYNDFESVAALMRCMDVIISPATTVAELAGALGCETLMFSNSSEIDWRKKDRAGCDIWHNSMEIVDVKEKGDKVLLVEELRRRLMLRINSVASVESLEA